MRTLKSFPFLGVLLFGCNPAAPPPSAATVSPAAATAAAATTSSAASAGPTDGVEARVGAPAPAFTLRDLDGHEVSLAQYRGKRVVLEWFNEGCPFVDKSHTAGSLKTLAAEATAKGVVWLAINSSSEGKQGHGAEANRKGAERYHLAHPVLLDSDGVVGKRYGAKRTPQMFVIDEKGTLVYAGAIDNSPDAEGLSPEGGKLVNYVTEALAALDAGKPVAVPETKPYGCSVKYAK